MRFDLDGLDGLLHITDMSWGRVSHPSEMVNKGEEIAICIIDKNNKILDDMNSCMFIIIHELAHIMTISEHMIIGSILTFSYFSKLKSKFK